MTIFKGISCHDLPLTDNFYTFVDNSGEVTHVAADVLLRSLKRAGVVPQLAAMGAGLLAAIERGDLNVEEDHAHSLPEEALATPLMVGAWGEEHIIIDGSHRLWRRWKRGYRDFLAYLVPETTWRQFVIYDMPFDATFWDYHNRNSKVR